jgi:hypothetical protein
VPLLGTYSSVDRAENTKQFELRSFYDTVHIDEKWFYLQEGNRKIMLCEDEPTPYRSCKHKKRIAKVMFIAAQVRPRYDFNRKCTWDGKLVC